MIVFLLDSISQPRCIKRINSFIDNGFEVLVYGYDRGKYNVNAMIVDKQIQIIGKRVDGKNYISNFFSNQKEIRKIVKSHNSNDSIFFSFGFAFTLALKINGCSNYIYEISDIIYGYKHFKYLRWIFKKVDKFLIRKSLITVLTSEGFGAYLYKDNWPSKLLVQTNRLSSYFAERPREFFKEIRNEKLVFAFIGAFRSPDTIFRFAENIGKKYPQHEFHFYGDSHSRFNLEVIKISQKYTNVKYFGSFKSPEDLDSIYQNINIVIACYDTQDLNERILEPNKFYEALYFKKPIIVSEQTFLAEKVKKLGCGFAIDASSDNSITTFLTNLSSKDLENVVDNINKVPISEIVDDNSSNIIKFINSTIVN